MTEQDRVASRGSHALFWLVLGAEDSARHELDRMTTDERHELLWAVQRLQGLL